LAAAPADGGPANIHVALPADATLTIDGLPTKSTSASRWFVTPPLAAGKSFAYNLKAEFVREGKTITVEEKVWVRAGRETDVFLDVAGLAAARSPYLYGAGSADVRAFYYTPEAAAPRSTGFFAPAWSSDDYSPPVDRTVEPGFNPIHWGVDEHSPWYPEH
jgi:uncharacterized protein (TIGR03000 family)